MTAPLTDGRPLTPREAAFVAWYLVLRNATEAYRRAGFEATTSANRNAHRLRQNPVVAAAIAAGEAQAKAAADVKRADVIGAAADLAVEQAVTQAEVLRTLREVTSRGLTKEEWHPTAVVAAAKLLGLEAGMFKERHEMTGPNGGAIEVTVTRRIIAVDPTTRLAFVGDN